MSVKSPKKSLFDYFKRKNEDKLAKKKDEDEGDAQEVSEEITTSNGRGRPTRACANKAREAWNDVEESVSSSDDDEDFKRKTRKRGRPSNQNGSKRGRQATLSNNGKLICKDPESNSAKKKCKLDPEREAFLRSGVPDVIKKAKERAKAKEAEFQELSSDDDEQKPDTEKRRTLDPETLAFLHSGVPESLLKSRQLTENRRKQDEHLVSMGFFPKINHTVTKEDIGDGDQANSEIKIPFTCKRDISESQESAPDCSIDQNVEFQEYLFSKSSSDFSCLSSQESDLFQPIGICCDINSAKLSPRKNIRKSAKTSTVPTEDNRPWIEATKVSNVKDLVVDANGIDTLKRWLKQWRSDIKDDGGASRKQEKKKKRGNQSDSDFITSDEEESEMKKKSVLLTGPSGCGKTAAVYVLAKHFEFEVVEVNFSSRRSGKEVLQKVEEAVLSHRLKSSRNCLVLFKDIDLFDPEEDEGFFSSVAQLITTALRPIVMTSSIPVYSLIDSKLDRKDPLRITFTFPKPRVIVDKILKPILASIKYDIESAASQGMDQWLDSIVRHSGCDIRQCINQLQLLTSTSVHGSQPEYLSNDDIHLYTSPFLLHMVDLNFPRQEFCIENGSSDICCDQEDEEVNLSPSARKRKCYTQLQNIGNSLELFADLDWISRPSSCNSVRNVNIYGDVDEAKWHWSYISKFRSPFFTRLALNNKSDAVEMKKVRELVLESDAEVNKWMAIDGLNDEIAQYCGSDGVGGIDWESCGTVRTIIKTNRLDSAVGRVQKRNGRMASYFNRVDRELVNKVCDTFDFQTQLNSVKLYD